MRSIDHRRAWFLGVTVSLTPGCAADEFAYDTREEWEAAARSIREGIEDHLAIDPDAPRPPLGRVSIHGRQEHDGYSIENVSFTSLPGFYVTGNLYRPLGVDGPVPVVLNPHGHFDEPGWYPRTRPDMQARAATLARMGAVAFTWDMVGMGDSTQLEHDDAIVPALQTWNSLRVVDFVLTLPEVLDEAARVGVQTHVQAYPLSRLGDALCDLKLDAVRGAAVIDVAVDPTGGRDP